MLQQKFYLKILADKPDIFSPLPEAVLPEHAIEALRQIPRLAVAEISGPADAAAIYELVSRFKPDGLLPVVSYTGSEYGNWAALDKTIVELKKLIEKKLHIFCASSVVLGAPGLWKELRQAHETDLEKSFGFANRCLGCRLYSFIIHVPLCKIVDAVFFIPALHGLAQRGCPSNMDSIEKKYFSYLMSSYGIEVCTQVLLQDASDSCSDGITCVLSGKAVDRASPEKLIHYFETFALPAASSILSRAIFGTRVDYCQSISEFSKPRQVPKKIERSKNHFSNR